MTNRLFFLRFVSAGLIAALTWSCASGPKPSQEPAKPKIAAPAGVQTPLLAPSPADKTILPPPEEKKAMDPAVAEKPLVDRDDTSVSLENALNLYQEAKLAREGGNLVAALQMLDEAYSIILRVKIPPDSALLQDKDNLRVLIAQRILEINAVRRNPVNGNSKAIPMAENQWVANEIKLFTGLERKAFEQAYKRSGLYVEGIREELRKAGMPEDLCWLPVIESWFQPRALSRARALGMWQFIASTGFRYGLSQDRFIDERMDPYKATRAAMKYLDELHSLFGDWTSALAAYNCGEGAVQRVIASQNINYLDNFWDLFQRLPYETARFVPRFIAAVSIIRDPAKYGMTLPEPYSPLKFEVAKVNRPTKLSALAKALGLEASELTYLNPELRQDSTPDREYDLRVPVGLGEKTLQAIDSIPKYVPPVYETYIVRSGDTLSAIARKFGTSVPTLININGLRTTYLIFPGQALKIPGRG
jgi:membrane-bound lytic murein transglycosylase D